MIVLVEEQKPIYVSRSRRSPGRGNRVRYPAVWGAAYARYVKIEETTQGRWKIIRLHWGGRTYRMLNCALPIDASGQAKAHPKDAVCDKCGHVYSHLMERDDQTCDECRSDAYVLRALAMQEDYGIDLGVRVTIDPTLPCVTLGEAIDSGLRRVRLNDNR